jgi:DNA-binding CsgD family transcriptional regulator
MSVLWRVSVRPSKSAPGILLLDPTTLKLYAFNPEALQILAYPANPLTLKQLSTFLAEVINSRLVHRNTGTPAFAAEFPSGNRRYQCSVFRLEKQLNGRPAPIALLFERGSSSDSELLQVSKEFNLTPREQRTVQLLVEGLTSKEIANRMNVSPNTVKAFLRLVMVKMGTSTRSGVLSKLFDCRQGQVHILRNSNSLVRSTEPR